MIQLHRDTSFSLRTIATIPAERSAQVVAGVVHEKEGGAAWYVIAHEFAGGLERGDFDVWVSGEIDANGVPQPPRRLGNAADALVYDEDAPHAPWIVVRPVDFSTLGIDPPGATR